MSSYSNVCLVLDTITTAVPNSTIADTKSSYTVIYLVSFIAYDNALFIIVDDCNYIDDNQRLKGSILYVL